MGDSRSKNAPTQEDLHFLLSLPLFSGPIGWQYSHWGRIFYPQFSDLLSVETPSQTYPEVCFTNFLTASQFSQVDKINHQVL
jgi:hypothetical protein